MSNGNNMVSAILMEHLTHKLVHPHKNIAWFFKRRFISGINVPPNFVHFAFQPTFKGCVYFIEKLYSADGQTIVPSGNSFCRLHGTAHGATENRSDRLVFKNISCRLRLATPLLAQKKARQTAIINQRRIIDLSVPDKRYPSWIRFQLDLLRSAATSSFLSEINDIIKKLAHLNLLMKCSRFPELKFYTFDLKKIRMQRSCGLGARILRILSWNLYHIFNVICNCQLFRL